MNPLSKILVAGAVVLGVGFGIARRLIPPTVYVWVSIEDATGERVPLSEDWFWQLEVRGQDHCLVPGMVVVGSDDLTSEGRYRRMEPMTGRFLTGPEHAVFPCRPGREAAFACMVHDLGSAEAVVDLPDASPWIPWSIKHVRLRVPSIPEAPLGELTVTVARAEGSEDRSCMRVSLASPEAGLPLLDPSPAMVHGSSWWSEGPLRLKLPAGSYRVGTEPWTVSICGNMAPFREGSMRTSVICEVVPGDVTEAVIDRCEGTYLDLSLSLDGDGGAFAQGREAFLKDWERSLSDPAGQPVHPWRAEARLQPLSRSGEPTGREWAYVCRWDECCYVAQRRTFPVAGRIEGLRQYPAGRYRLTLKGTGIETVSQEIEISDLKGQACEVAIRLRARGAAAVR